MLDVMPVHPPVLVHERDRRTDRILDDTLVFYRYNRGRVRVGPTLKSSYKLVDQLRAA